MSIHGRSSAQTSLPDSSWRSQKLFYLAVFAVTGVAVYRWGLATAQPPQPAATYTSTATIHVRDGLPAAEPEKIRQQISSTANVYRAVRRLGLPTQPPPDEEPQATATRVAEEVGRGLQVTADASSPPGELAVSIAYTNPSPQYCAQLANTLAECYADECRAEWQRQAQQACAAACQSTDRAQQEFLQANARLEEFFQRHLTTPQPGPPAKATDANRPQADKELPDPTHAEQSQPQTPAAATPVTTPPADDPERSELHRRLAALKQRRTELLIDRTPLHPEVQETELRIAALERQLAATPKDDSAAPPDGAGATGARPVPPAADDARGSGVTPVPPAGDRTETVRTFQTLRQAADRAAAAYFEALKRERSAWQEHQREPRITLDLARPSRPPTTAWCLPPAPPRLAVLLAALAAGLTVAAGVVMISAGAGVQFPVTTVEQVRNALPVPVVGTIPETHPTSRPTIAQRRRRLLRWALIAGGLALIGACLGWLLWAWGG